MRCIYLENKTNIVFWFSEKAGCTYVKGLYLKYLGIDKLWPHRLPEEGLETTNRYFNNEISDPIHILFIRNPYKRLVSGFLEKLTSKPNLPDRHEYFIDNFKISNGITFEWFVATLENHRIFRNHHFDRQVSYAYRPELTFARVFDIEHIDRDYLNQLFGTSVDEPDYRGYLTRYRYYSGPKPAYRLSISELNRLDYRPEYQQFYNPVISREVARLFAADLQYFEQQGFRYSRPLNPT